MKEASRLYKRLAKTLEADRVKLCFEGEELAWKRGSYLRELDKRAKLRVSYENPYIQELYKNFLGEPLSEKAEHYLHTNQKNWTL